jgi:hypothetical protein
MGKNKDVEKEGSIDAPEKNTENKSPEKKEPMYNVRNLSNRPHEVFIKQKTIRWDANGRNPMHPAEYVNGLPESIVNHKNFATQKKYFQIVKIVKK